VTDGRVARGKIGGLHAVGGWEVCESDLKGIPGYFDNWALLSQYYGIAKIKLRCSVVVGCGSDEIGWQLT